MSSWYRSSLLGALLVCLMGQATQATSAAEKADEVKLVKVPPPFTSHEDFEYIDAAANGLFTFMKQKGYKGIVNRVYGQHEFTRKFDFYQLSLSQKTTPADLCPLVLERLFGIPKSDQGEKAKATYKGVPLSSEDLGKRGLFCQARILDTTTGTLSPIKHLLVRRFEKHVWVFVSRVPAFQKDVSFSDAADFAGKTNIKPQ